MGFSFVRHRRATIGVNSSTKGRGLREIGVRARLKLEAADGRSGVNIVQLSIDDGVDVDLGYLRNVDSYIRAIQNLYCTLCHVIGTECNIAVSLPVFRRNDLIFFANIPDKLLSCIYIV